MLEFHSSIWADFQHYGAEYAQKYAQIRFAELRCGHIQNKDEIRSDLMATKAEKRNGRYRSRASYVDETGKQRFRSFTADKAKDAEYRARQFEQEQEHEAKPENITLRNAMIRYVENREEGLSPPTVADYYKRIRNSYNSIIDMRLGNLTVEHIQKAMNDYSKNRKAKTVHNSLALLSSVLVDIFPDLSSKILVKESDEKEIVIPTQEQMNDIIMHAEDKEIYLAILLGAMLGLSRSEILGLSWESINLAKNTLTIRKVMVQDKNNAYVLKDTPKTKFRRRTLALSAPIRNEIDKRDKAEPLFTMNLSQFTDRYRWIAGKVGAPQGLHTLRHYNASVMALLNIPMKYAEERMGHGSSDMLRKVYQHTFENEHEVFAEKMDAFFSERLGK